MGALRADGGSVGLGSRQALGQDVHRVAYLLFGMMGRDEEARAHMKKVLEYDPRFNIEDRRKRNLFKDQALNERELDAHRKAGAPEHPPSK